MLRISKEAVLSYALMFNIIVNVDIHSEVPPIEDNYMIICFQSLID